MLIRVEPKYRKRHVAKPAKQQAVANAPVLVEASFDTDAHTVTLRFDVAIDVSELVVSEVVVKDANVPIQWGGDGGVSQPGGPNTVLINMVEDDDYSGEFTTLTVDAGVDIVAADGGLPWAGVTDLQLPFPS